MCHLGLTKLLESKAKMLPWIANTCKRDWSVKNKSVKGRGQIFSRVVSGNADGQLLKKLWRFISENSPFNYFPFTYSHRIKNCRNIKKVDKLHVLAHKPTGGVSLKVEGLGQGAMGRN